MQMKEFCEGDPIEINDGRLKATISSIRFNSKRSVALYAVKIGAGNVEEREVAIDAEAFTMGMDERTAVRQTVHARVEGSLRMRSALTRI